LPSISERKELEKTYTFLEKKKEKQKNWLFKKQKSRVELSGVAVKKVDQSGGGLNESVLTITEGRRDTLWHLANRIERPGSLKSILKRIEMSAGMWYDIYYGKESAHQGTGFPLKPPYETPSIKKKPDRNSSLGIR